MSKQVTYDDLRLVYALVDEDIDVSDIVPQTTTQAKILDMVKAGGILSGTPLSMQNEGDYYKKIEIDNFLLNKVDTVEGKQLSTEDFTTDEKTKLASLQNYDDGAIQEHIGDTNTHLTVDDRIKINNIKDGTNVAYSTEEKEIGTWTDGSKIYEKTIVYNEALPNADIDSPQYLDFDFDMTDIDLIIRQEGIIRSNLGVNTLPYVSFASSQGKTYVANLTISGSNNKIRLYTTMNLSTYTSLFITVRYTKKATE